MPRHRSGDYVDLPEWVSDLLNARFFFVIAVVVVSAVIYILRRRRPQVDKTSTAYLAAKARKKLVKALLGDQKAADRLIAYEHSRAGQIGCGKLEAIERALIRLQGDRSRVN